MNETFTISELASEFGVTTRTIRFYEDQGLLSPTRQGTSRVFSARDRVRLKLALRGKRLGFSIAEIRELFELYDISRDEKKQIELFLGKLERRRALLEQQREDIEVMLNEITFFANQCRRLLKSSQGEREAKPQPTT
ncbi:MAG: MerR family DNA-binding transcriptional regulator [Gammaproteobacteria bacterium]|nr:MerR family DNA-binding transcriptional regulator [Gammaproteobacteria bacterium]